MVTFWPWQPDAEKRCAVIFERPTAHCLGPPNDEALHGHPFYEGGLDLYRWAEVLNSPWIQQICERNRVHMRHTDTMFDSHRQFIGTFQDSTLEVIAQRYSFSDSADIQEKTLKEIRV